MLELTTPTTRVIDTAVIPLAGLGTRMWPATAGIPKFMVPIMAGTLARPNIDFTLDDCIAAGIRNFIFITSNGGEDILRRYLGPLDDDIIQRYTSLGKHDDLARELSRRDVYADLTIEFIDQPVGMYGTAVPLKLAQPRLAGVPYFAVTGGDDFAWSADGSSELQRQIVAWQAKATMHSIMGKPVPRAEGPKYGILQVNTANELAAITEKPALSSLPEGPVLANISRYLLADSIWPQLDLLLHQPRTSEHPEYPITDVIISALASGQNFDVHEVVGTYFDAGSPRGVRHASDTITAQQ